MIIRSERDNIISTWSNVGAKGEVADVGTARWLSDYQPKPDENLEQEKLEARKSNLIGLFKKWDLLEPAVIIDDGRLGMRGHDPIGNPSSKILEVFAFYVPVVEEYMLRPIVDIRTPGFTPEQAQEYLIRKCLRLGSKAIKETFGSSIGPQ